MKILYISGSPRKGGNSEYLLNLLSDSLKGELVRLSDYKIEPCKSCWACIKTEKCVINDDMTNKIIPVLLDADVIVLGSPVYFNNVSAQLKAFMDRTWCIKGRMRNKIGGAVVVGSHDGAQSAVDAINSFFLKHEMIPANRGVCGIAFEKGEIKQDAEAIAATGRLAERISGLWKLTRASDVR
ncbi:flavodoxin family protein [Candidatus Micrarchaeota archaeon CG10_big_fil_rev_8_21_14_0_10_59_7]|nr:MAG: flavodoxin family protein [Candidatus Micrarchaeota archaeon CG10_big_fil_rev_8_21_14_0_10_59_7]